MLKKPHKGILENHINGEFATSTGRSRGIGGENI